MARASRLRRTRSASCGFERGVRGGGTVSVGSIAGSLVRGNRSRARAAKRGAGASTPRLSLLALARENHASSDPRSQTLGWEKAAKRPRRRRDPRAHLITILLHVLLRAVEDLLLVGLGLSLGLRGGLGLVGGPRLVALTTLKSGLGNSGLLWRKKMERGVSDGSRVVDDADVKRRRDERNNPRASQDIVAARVGASRGRRASSEAVRRARTAAGKFPQTEGKPRRKVATGTPRRRGLDPQRRRARRDGREGRVAHHIVLLRNGLSRCPRDLCAAIRGPQRRADALFSTNQTLVFAGRVLIPRYLSNHAAVGVVHF